MVREIINIYGVEPGAKKRALRDSISHKPSLVFSLNSLMQTSIVGIVSVSCCSLTLYLIFF